MKTSSMRNKLPSTLSAVALGMLAASGTVQAEVTTTVSGYGTVGAAVINKSDLEFRSSMNQAVGAGSHPDFGVDTRLGLQGVIRFNPQFSVTGQVLAQRKREDATAGSNNDLNAGFEWAFAQYSPISNLDLRAGRVVLPIFMISDSRNVSYSQPWLRAPSEVYAGMPISTLDGAQLLWRIPISDAILTIQPSYGHSSVNVQGGSAAGALPIDVRATDIKAINVSLEWGDWLIRAGQMRARLPLSLAALVPVLPEPLQVKDKFTGVGLQYDNGRALFMTEWAQRREPNQPVAPFNDPVANSFWPLVAPAFGGLGGPIGRSYGWYAAGGWHFGKWLPMLIYGQDHEQGQDYITRSTQMSVRYDVTSSASLKAQIGRHEARDGNSFVTPDDKTSHRKVNALSVGVDFVF